MTAPDLSEVLDRAEAVVAHEFLQFQQVRNEGGRADCQDDWPMFRQMRLSQFLTWPTEAVASYEQDLKDADAQGRNLLTEKYARMMESVEPERFARELAPFLPKLDPARVERQERVIGIQVQWAREFHRRFPKLGAAMRTLTSDQDTLETTSFETYLRGELCTYSDHTFDMYERLVDDFSTAGGNLTEKTLAFTVALAGFGSLAEAEARQAL